MQVFCVSKILAEGVLHFARAFQITLGLSRLRRRNQSTRRVARGKRFRCAKTLAQGQFICPCAVKCPADSKTGAFAPCKHFAAQNRGGGRASLRPSISKRPWVEPPAAAKPIPAPSGARQAFSLRENLGTGAIHLSLCCQMSCETKKEEHCKAVLFFFGGVAPSKSELSADSISSSEIVCVPC